ncbi:MAG: NAD(+) diphosphatase [Rikenellaceae bacterium]
MAQDKYYWFIICKGAVLLDPTDNKLTIPIGVVPPIKPPKETTIHTFSTLNSIECKTFEIEEPIADYKMVDIRSTFDLLTWDEYYTAGKASQILHWDKNSQFCPKCGVQTPQIAPIAKKCPQCNQEFYPRISPAAIVLVKKEDSILLVHARSYRGTQNGLVAGFLEVGETLEACVHREVFEETGLRVDNLRYFGNQPWPYPSGLMVGFVADYVSGEIKLQDDELTSGAFYTRENMPEIPPKLSIARQMIDAWYEGSI